MDMIPYNFKENGYDYTLISVKNDFSKPNGKTLISAEYEDQLNSAGCRRVNN